MVLRTVTLKERIRGGDCCMVAAERPPGRDHNKQLEGGRGIMKE